MTHADDIRDLLALDNCPKCFDRWAYESRGRRYSYPISLYDRDSDQTRAYMCPGCGERWER